MYIVFVTAFFTDSTEKPLSGMPGYIYKTVKYLRQRGHRVEIVAGADYGRMWEYKGITIHDCEVSGILEGNYIDISRKILQRELSFQNKLRELNKVQEIDIVQYAGWSGVGFLHSLKCPGILRLSTYSCIQYKQSEIFTNVKCYSFWERMAGRHADGILCPSKVLGHKFGKDIRKKVVIMETPYDNSVFEDESLYKSKLEGKEYFLFYGQTSIDKGFEVIEDMMVDLLGADRNLFFVVAGWNSPQGKGNAIGVLKKKLGKDADRFIYLGPVAQSLLFPVIRRAKGVLIPSLIDNLPNSCLEAMYLGQIVIGTYNTSLEQLIENEVNGYLVNPGDKEDLLKAAKKVCRLSEEERLRMVENSKKILKFYEPRYVIGKLEKYYQWIIAQKTGERHVL